MSRPPDPGFEEDRMPQRKRPRIDHMIANQFLFKLNQAGLTEQLCQVVIGNKGNVLAKKIVDFIIQETEWPSRVGLAASNKDDLSALFERLDMLMRAGMLLYRVEREVIIPSPMGPPGMIFREDHLIITVDTYELRIRRKINDGINAFPMVAELFLVRNGGPKELVRCLRFDWKPFFRRSREHRLIEQLYDYALEQMKEQDKRRENDRLGDFTDKVEKIT